MNEIKWPIVILTNYRTGSNTLGYALAEQYSAKYFEEPSQDPTRLVDFKQFYYERGQDQKYIIKFMIDQLDDLDVYQELLATDCHKIRLLRLNEVEQCVSYYVAMRRQLWKQETPVIDAPYSVDINLRTMSWTTCAILQNNADLRASELKFDEDLIYEELSLPKEPRFFKTTQPENIDEIRASVANIIKEGRLGHYNVAWKRYKHSQNYHAELEYNRTRYLFDWFYDEEPIQKNSSISNFSMREDRKSTDTAFWPVFQLPPIKHLFINDNPRMDISIGTGMVALERNDSSHPQVYTQVPYTRSTDSEDGLTRITEFHCADKKFLNNHFITEASQLDYWEQHLHNKKNDITFTRTLTTVQQEPSSLFCMRSPGDDFTLSLFLRLTQQIEADVNLLYIWSLYLDPNFRSNDNPHLYEGRIRLLMYRHIQQGPIVLGIKDHMTTKPMEYDSQVPTVAEYLVNMFDFYKDRKIVLFTSMENLGSYITNDNVSIIPWGGDITNHQKEYQTVQPILDKNLHSGHTYISLNRGDRQHRTLVVGLLHGLGIQEQGIISCLFDFEYASSGYFPFTPEQTDIEQLFAKGRTEFSADNLMIKDTPDSVYPSGENDNVGNFENNLSQYYRNSFVEIITETSCLEKAYLLTEKTLNCVYGCNFPIMICSAGAVAFLREMGLDMFDDVVNHAYDSIENPIERIHRAITDNMILLTDNARTKQLWQDNRSRFEKNVEFVRSNLYEFYADRATTKFNQVMHDYL